MVEEIYEIKNEILEQLRKEIDSKGIERIDKEMVDMVKDLAEAEEKCWKAEYYRSVTEAMEGQQGYSENQRGGYQGNQGNQRGGYEGNQRGNRASGYGQQRWGNQYGSGGGNGRRGSRRGYGMGHMEALESVKMALQNAEPEERERMTQELRSMMGGQM